MNAKRGSKLAALTFTAFLFLLIHGTSAGDNRKSFAATAGTGSSSTGDVPPGARFDATYYPPQIALQSQMNEYRSRNSWGVSGGSTKHAVQASFFLPAPAGWKVPNPADPPGISYDPVTFPTNNLSFFYSEAHSFRTGYPTVDKAPNSSPQPDPGDSGRIYQFYNDGSSLKSQDVVSLIGDWRPKDTYYDFYALNPTELGSRTLQITFNTIHPPNGISSSPQGAYQQMFGNDSVIFQAVSATTINPQTVSVLFRKIKNYHVLNYIQNITHTVDLGDGIFAHPYQYTEYYWAPQQLITYESWTFSLRKLQYGDASVDTREANYDPNVAVEDITDQTERDHYNFGSWVFKGGLFVGRVPVASGDHSGLARLQLYAPASTTWSGITKCATLSMFYMGYPPDITGFTHDEIIGMYYVDPNAPVTTEAGVSWDYKWDTPPTAVYSKEFYDPSGPITPPPVNDYANWYMTPGTGQVPRLDMRMVNEGLNNTWRYFGSKEWSQLPNSPWYQVDGWPRVWLLDQTAYSSY